MRKHILSLVAFLPVAVSAQTPVVRLINAADASSKPEFGTVAAVRQLAGGRLLVNDIQNRQLTILDPGLGNAFLLADSTSGQLNSYGTRPGGLISYLADTTLFVDPAGLSMFVIDPGGKIARVASVPRSQDAASLGSNLLGTPGVDAKGRLVYRSMGMRITQQGGGKGGGGFAMPELPDSAPLVRVDLATRKVDTAGFYKIPKTKMNIVQTDKGMTATSEINPMQVVDDWAVLSNGAIAVVRGQDYHVDFIGPDGAVSPAPKIPFDWQRMSDEDKVAVIDSAKAAFERQRAAANSGDAASVAAAAARGAAGGGGAPGSGMVVMNFRTDVGGDGGGINTKMAGLGGGMTPSFVSAGELPDYRPVFAQGAARADDDGNVWIRTSATRTGGVAGTIYDVINARGALVDRVQLPAGRSIVGFGKGGVVYMVARDKTGTWIERTHR